MIGIISARMDSKRFPNKMMSKLWGQPLLEFIICRASDISYLNNLIIATTDRPVDDIIVEVADHYSVPVHRGRLGDVARQFVECGKHYKSDYLLRLNGDSPCFDINLIEQGFAFCNEDYDLITNIPSRTFPYGIALEIIKTSALGKAYPLMDEAERQHVTLHFYKHPKSFKIKEVLNQGEKLDFKFAIDDPSDLERLNEYLLHSSAWN